MSVTVSDQDPAVITKITLTVIPPPAGAPLPKQLTQQAAIAAWEAQIDKPGNGSSFSRELAEVTERKAWGRPGPFERTHPPDDRGGRLPKKATCSASVPAVA